MADLIDRQAVRLIESDANAYPEEWNDDYEKGFTDALNKVIALPSAQPEIIRCKDCNHYQFADNRVFADNREFIFGTPVKVCAWFGFEDFDDDDFCSRAERRTDD